MSAHSSSPAEASSRQELATRRVLDAPRERVFEAFRDPAHLARWWGPKGFTNTFHEFDFRPGGQWRFIMHGPGGANFQNHSVFVEVVPLERIVLQHESAPRFQMTLTLTEQAGKTELTWRQRFESVADCERVSKFAIEANEQNLDRLEAELAAMR